MNGVLLATAILCLAVIGLGFYALNEQKKQRSKR